MPGPAAAVGGYAQAMGDTRSTRIVRAPRASVYAALLDAESVRHWMVPDSMTSHIHSFDAREGGGFRISLTYDAPTTAGKSSDRTDTFHGRFVRLVQDTEVVQVVEFETDDPSMQGEMTITYRLTEVAGDDGDGPARPGDGGITETGAMDTEVVGHHEHVPPGVSPADNELGWTMSMGKLARLVETDRPGAEAEPPA